MKVKVRLKADIDQPGQGFLDPAGQKIRAAHPKPGEKFQKGKIFEVEKTDFVIERIKTGELILVDNNQAGSEDPGITGARSSTEAAVMIIDDILSTEKEIPKDVRKALELTRDIARKAIKANTADAYIEAEQKATEITEKHKDVIEPLMKASAERLKSKK